MSNPPNSRQLCDYDLTEGQSVVGLSYKGADGNCSTTTVSSQSSSLTDTKRVGASLSELETKSGGVESATHHHLCSPTREKADEDQPKSSSLQKPQDKGAVPWPVGETSSTFHRTVQCQETSKSTADTAKANSKCNVDVRPKLFSWKKKYNVSKQSKQEEGSNCLLLSAVPRRDPQGSDSRDVARNPVRETDELAKALQGCSVRERPSKRVFFGYVEGDQAATEARDKLEARGIRCLDYHRDGRCGHPEKIQIGDMMAQSHWAVLYLSEMCCKGFDFSKLMAAQSAEENNRQKVVLLVACSHLKVYEYLKVFQQIQVEEDSDSWLEKLIETISTQPLSLKKKGCRCPFKRLSRRYSRK